MTDFTTVLAAIQAGVSVIKTVVQTAAITPGLNAIPYIDVVAGGITALDAGIKAGINVTNYAESMLKTFEDGIPPLAEVEALKTKMAELEALADAPLPAPEPGEPE